nr:MAG TPA: hypothetical protein [Caudoviricetes sp.]
MRVLGQNIQRHTQTLILTLIRRKEEYTHARTRLMPARVGLIGILVCFVSGMLCFRYASAQVITFLPAGV